MSRASMAAILLLAAAGGRLTAQPRPAASISGIVTDSAGHPLDGAEVWLVGDGKRAVSGRDGAFRFDGLKGTVRTWLAARHIGHYPTQVSVAAEPGEQRTVTVVMAPHPFDLPELAVKAAVNEQRRRLIDFAWRARSAYSGRFLTRDDIARANVSQLGHLVIRYLPFKNFSAMDEPGGFGYDATYLRPSFASPLLRDPYEWTASTVGGDLYIPPASSYLTSAVGGYSGSQYRDCPPAVAINGGGILPGLAVNDFKPEELEAVEIYRGGSGLPLDYGINNRSSCGLVVVWLKAFAQAPAETERRP